VRGAGYTRVSTESQARSGVSLEEQEQLIRERAKEDGVELIDIFCDPGRSGSTPFGDRLGGAGVLAAAESLDVLYVWSFDRFGRTALDVLSATASLRGVGCRVVSITEDSIDDSTPDGNFMRGMKALMAEREREGIIERNRMAAGALFRAGRFNGPAPLGYRHDDGSLAIVDHEAAVVRRIFHDFIAGQNLSRIARALNAESIKTKRNGIWRQGTLSQLIRNPAYVGRVRRAGIEREGSHPPIVDQTVFGTAQSLLEGISTRKGAGRGRPPKAQHLFIGGTLRCGECGEAMTPRTPVKGRPHYLCAGAQSLGCSMPQVRREVVDSAVYAYFEQVGLDVRGTRRALRSSADHALAAVRAQLEQASQEAGHALARLDRLDGEYADGKLNNEEWRSLKLQFGSESAAADCAVDRLREQSARVEALAKDQQEDVELLRQLSAIRESVVGDMRAIDGINSARAALGRLFDHFVIHRQEAFQGRGPVHVELGLAAGFVVEPFVRPDAIEGFSDFMTPRLSREPLMQPENKQQEGVGYRLVEG
jgi:site-specific DNA recombinase